MTYLPSLYKARGIPVKSPVCAICLDRTRGKALERQLTHGVRVWLCEGHHSVAFLRRNAGREFVVTLSRIWRSNGCLTRARSHALDAHLAAIRAIGQGRRGRGPAPTPGPACGVKPRKASPAASACSRRSRGSVSGMLAITPPSRASARCADGSPTAVGSDLRRTTTRISPNSPGATRRRPCRSRRACPCTCARTGSSRRGPRRGRCSRSRMGVLRGYAPGSSICRTTWVALGDHRGDLELQRARLVVGERGREELAEDRVTAAPGARDRQAAGGDRPGGVLGEEGRGSCLRRRPRRPRRSGRRTALLSVAVVLSDVCSVEWAPSGG